jgi:peptide-methionine (R)-S-oxide reductase
MSEKPKHLIDVGEVNWLDKDEEYWRSVLTEEEYRVCRKGGTERPFSGEYCNTFADGNYRCKCCGELLFVGAKKFDSGTGWPSFTEAAKSDVLEYIQDDSFGMSRTEVRCKRCGAHLGHVFPDGPLAKDGTRMKRYCINSICLFKED